MSGTGYIIHVDPSEMATRFADSPEVDLDTVSAEDVAAIFAMTSDEFEDKVVPLLDRIPDRESDYINLYFLKGKKQADIAEIFGVTQAAVSYRLDRGIKRIQFLLSIPSVTEEDMRRDLAKVFPQQHRCLKCKGTGIVPEGIKNASVEWAQVQEPESFGGMCRVCSAYGTFPINVEILVGMWTTSCQSKVALSLGLTQGRVRHRFFRAVRVLETAAAKEACFDSYYQIFKALSSKKFNILREVKLPQWQDRGRDECI